MTKKQFKNLKIGDVVELNGRCRGNEGIRCYVDWIIDNRIWVKTLDGKPNLSIDGGIQTNWNEITYAGANIVNSKYEG